MKQEKVKVPKAKIAKVAKVATAKPMKGPKIKGMAKPISTKFKPKTPKLY